MLAELGYEFSFSLYLVPLTELLFNFMELDGRLLTGYWILGLTPGLCSC